MNPRYFPLWIALIPAFSSCHRAAGPHGALETLPPVQVSLLPIRAEAIPVMDQVVGTVRPRLEASVSAKVTGRVLNLDAVPGGRVKKDQVLARIDPGELEAMLEAARATLEQAQRDQDRAQQLVAQNAMAKAELEKATAHRRVSAARLKETESLIANTVVTAPFDGTVTRRLMEPGDLATPGRALFVMEDSSLLRLEIDVAEALAGPVALGQAFRVAVEGAGLDVQGKVSEVAPSADVGSRTFRIKLDLPPAPALRAGQFGRAFLPRGDRKALLVPATSTLRRGQMDYVFVAAGGKAQLRIVRLGETAGNRVEVLAGLDEGDQLVVNPPAELRDGQPLTAP